MAVTKENVIDKLVHADLFRGRQIIATLTNGSRLYNLETEDSDYDFKVIYLPNRKDLYTFNSKPVKNYKFDVNGSDVEVSMIDFRFFLQNLRKSNVETLALLYDVDFVVNSRRTLYAPKDYLIMFEMLISVSDIIARIDLNKFYSSTMGILLQYKKKFEKRDDFSKAYSHYIRVFNILMAIYAGEQLRDYFVTDGSLRALRDRNTEEDRLLFAKDLEDKEEFLRNNKELKSFFNNEMNDNLLVMIEKSLINRLFSSDIK